MWMKPSRSYRPIPPSPPSAVRSRLACVTHTHLTADPGSTGIDSVAGPAVTWLMIFEQVQHVLGAQEGPVIQQSVVLVGQSAPTTDRDQPRITLFREDRHALIPTIQETTWSSLRNSTGAADQRTRIDRSLNKPARLPKRRSGMTSLSRHSCVKLGATVWLIVPGANGPSSSIRSTPGSSRMCGYWLIDGTHVVPDDPAAELGHAVGGRAGLDQ